MTFLNSILKYFIRLILIKDTRIERSFPLVVYNDHIGKQVLIDGFYERFYLENIVKQFEPEVFKYTMIDVGANIGNHSVFFSKYFNKIIAFEPQKRIFQILKINCSTVPNIKIFNYGLSSKNKVLKFKIHKMNFGNAKEYEGELEENFFIEEVKLKKHHFDKKGKISVIKIDVEGSECDVIQSMKNEIIENRPIILFEYNNNDIKNLVVNQLNQLGYTNFYVFKKELMKNPFQKIFSKNLSKLIEINLNNESDFSMVVTFRKDSKFLLKESN